MSARPGRPRRRDPFFAFVSHELRTPLSGIRSWAHVLESRLRDADPAARRALAGIKTGVERQARLIDDLLAPRKRVTRTSTSYRFKRRYLIDPARRRIYRPSAGARMLRFR